MKIKLTLFLIIVLLSAPAVFSQGSYQDKFVNNEKEYSFRINGADLETTPTWNPEKESLVPLSVQKAIEIGRENLKRFIPKADDECNAKGIYLNELGKSKWFYSIRFYVFRRKAFLNPICYPIKLDSTIIEPIITLNKTSDYLQTPSPFFGFGNGFIFGVYSNLDEYKIDIPKRI